MRINAELPNKHLISCGGSGSGKSHYIKELIKKNKPNRLLIFDVSDEFSDFERFTDITELYFKLVSTKSGSYRYVGNDYIAFCLLARAWANNDDGALVVVVEEAASVSRVGKSEPAELKLITQGRKYGVNFCYIVQSLAEGSKTVLKNTNLLRIGISDEADIKYISNKYGNDLGDAVRALKNFDYVIFDKKNKKFTKFNAK